MASAPPQIKGRRTYFFSAVLILYSICTAFSIIPDDGLFVTGQSGAITSFIGAILAITLRLTLANMLFEIRERLIRVEAKLDKLFAERHADD